MNIVFWALFGIVIFFTFSLLRKWFDRFILIAFAIGAACCSNFYHAFSTPVVFGPFIFALDSILFTLFLMCIIIKCLHYSVEEAKSMAISSIVAIVISAFFEFFAKTASSGFSVDLVFIVLNYIFSAVGSLISIWLMIMFLKKTRGRNVYVRIAIAVLIGSFVNSLVYYVAVGLLGHLTFDTFWRVLCGSLIGKTYATGLGILFYYLNGKIFVPTDHNEINYHDLDQIEGEQNEK